MNNQGYMSPMPTNMTPNMGGAGGMGSMPNGGNMGMAPGGAGFPGASKKESPLKLIIIIVLAVFVVGLTGLAVWLYMQWDASRTDVQGQIDKAVATAELEQANVLEAEFAEREKEPFLTFLGPEDYGSLTFKYPKTWSFYEAKDASSGGDYLAYFNPEKVSASKGAINALTVTIENKSFESVISSYDDSTKEGTLKRYIVTINGVDATIYEGLINKELQGKVAIFKLRDKTIILQTDAEIFKADFDKVLQTVSFIQ